MTIKIPVNDLQAATSAAAALSPANLRKLKHEIDGMVKAEEARSGAEARRLSLLQSHVEGGTKTLHAAVGVLRRLGTSLSAMGTVADLTQRMQDANWTPEERIRPKTLLASIGAI
jgi:hypothetical protein